MQKLQGSLASQVFQFPLMNSGRIVAEYCDTIVQDLCNGIVTKRTRTMSFLQIYRISKAERIAKLGDQKSGNSLGIKGVAVEDL